MMAANKDPVSKKLEPVSLLNYEDDSQKRTFYVKAKENPLFPLGMAGFFGLVGYNITKIIRNRNQKQKLPISLQLIQTRMYAQGFVIGTLSLGVMYMLGTRIYAKLTHQKYEDPFTKSEN